METLSERFNALQDHLMNIYEAAKNTLEAQIEHWQLLRREAVLLFVARQKGVLRLGYQPVPPQAVSESKAKDAIMMVLQLQSLQNSKFKDEPWTLVDTSLETYRNQPENTFKKGPVSVEVMYDNDPTNTNVYTLWKYVYYLDADDEWQKTESGVNQTGIYYLQGAFKHYYILFADDAPRFSSTGQWEVMINKETVFAPVTSSTPPDSPGRQISGQGTGASTTNTETDHTATTETTTTSNQQRRPRYGRKDSSPTTTTSRQRSRKAQQRRRTRSRSVGSQERRIRSRSRSASRRGGHKRQRSRSTHRGRGRRSRSSSRGKCTRRRRRGRSSSSSSISTSCSASSVSSSSQRRKRGRGGSRSSSYRGISPGDVGKSVQTVSRRYKGRLGRLLAEAHDPPVILLKGAANTLKCFRNRTKIKYKDLFKCISTTFSWVANDGCERLGRHRMLISFISVEQRNKFDTSVKYPKTVERTYGSLDSL